MFYFSSTRMTEMTDRLRLELGRAGMLTRADRDQLVGRRPDHGEWLAQVDLRVVGDEQLDWDPDRARLVEDDRRLLDRFVDLARPGGDVGRRALRFAERYGLPHVCVHGNLLGRCGETSSDPFCHLLRPLPLHHLIQPAQEARSLLFVAAALHAGRVPAREDLSWLLGSLGWRDPDPAKPTGPDRATLAEDLQRDGPASQRRAVMASMNRWLAMGEVGVRFDWESGARRVDLTIGTLVGALARHMFLAICRDQGVRGCRCGNLFSPGHAGQKWCSDCRADNNKRMKTILQRDRRSRQREGRSKDTDG